MGILSVNWIPVMCPKCKRRLILRAGPCPYCVMREKMGWKYDAAKFRAFLKENWLLTLITIAAFIFDFIANYLWACCRTDH